MVSKTNLIKALYESKMSEITSSSIHWQMFLTVAANNYKYLFAEQVLIFAQKPDATACSDITTWNKKLNRWVNKGAKGIALLTNVNGYSTLRYVFDVSDTNNRFGKPFELWEVDEKYEDDVIESLENKFGELESSESMYDAIRSATKNILDDNLNDYVGEQQEGMYDLLLDSITYMVMVRCNMDVSMIHHERFKDITKFNEYMSTLTLGSAANEFTKLQLQEIYQTVKKLKQNEIKKIHTFEVEKKANYNKENGRSNANDQIQNEWGLSNSNTRDEREETSSSCYDDRIKYNKHIRPMFGDKAIRDIRPKEIIQWQREMMAKLSHTSVVNTHKVFSKLLNYGDRIFDTGWNPCNKVGYPKKLEKNKKTTIWTEEEFRQFYNAIDTLEYKVLFMIMFFCGLRRGELLALRWNDFTDNILEIDESIANDMGKQVIKRPKNFNAERFVELDNRITEMLKQLYSEKSQQVGFNEYNFIFGVKGDEPMGFETLRKAKVRYEERAGVKHIRIHDLRHSHVSLLMSHKIPIVAVAERIGDTVEEVLKTYSHALPKSNKEINRLINKLTKNYK